MNRLRQAGDSHYDVLGLPPGASAVEIDTSYRRLIDGEGYKVGVPLNRQWLRARQIKDAYGTLGDPEKRRAYDESLSRLPAAEPWAMTAADPATDSLILPQTEAEPSEPDEQELAADAAEPVEEEPTAGTAEPVEQELAADAAGPVEEEPAADAAEPVEQKLAAYPALASDTPPARSEPAGPEAGAPVDATGQGLVDAADDDERPAGRKWLIGAAAAAALVIGAITLWPGDPLPSTDPSAPGLAASPGEASGAGQGFVDQATGSGVADATSGADQPKAATAAPDAAQDAGEATDAPQAAGEAAGAEAINVQPAGDAPLTEAESASASSSSADADTAQVTAPAAPPPASPTQTTPAPPIMAERANGEIRSPAQWIGGGPTDADNRRGRYEGTVAVQVTVEADGSVSRCATVSGSGNAGLDDMTCRLVRERARFEPALDPQGRPVASQAYTSFTWGRRRPR